MAKKVTKTIPARKKKTQVLWKCEECGKTYDTRRVAAWCEKVHRYEKLVAGRMVRFACHTCDHLDPGKYFDYVDVENHSWLTGHCKKHNAPVSPLDGCDQHSEYRKLLPKE